MMSAGIPPTEGVDVSKTIVTTTACDLCNYGGPFTEPKDFTTIDGVDLCRWCADDTPKTQLECGRHLVTFAEGSWSCSCGERYRRPVFIPARVAAAVPSMVNATANAHVESR